MNTAKSVKKSLFIGEFQTKKKEGADVAKDKFFKLLNAIEKNDVPIAAVWVYDFTDRKTLTALPPITTCRINCRQLRRPTNGFSGENSGYNRCKKRRTGDFG